MAIRMASVPGPTAVPTARPAKRTGGNLAAAPSHATAWALDAEGFHREFDELFTGLVDDVGLVRFRSRAGAVWQTDDAATARYISSLRVHTPEEWNAGFEERHLAEWYRLLMVPYLRPIRGFDRPVLLKDGLPALGWTPSDARRLAWGRELATLAERYATTDAAAALAIVLGVGNKGWLSREDAEQFLVRFRSMDARCFRSQQHLVPVVEDAYEVLTAFAAAPETVVILPPLS